MFEFNRHYYLNACGTNVDFEVKTLGGSHGNQCPATFLVEVALRFVPDNILGSDIKIELLDEDYVPLKKFSPNRDFLALPAVDWMGQTSVFKSEEFESTGKKTSYLRLEVLGKPAVPPVAQIPVEGGVTLTPLETPGEGATLIPLEAAPDT